MSGIWGHYFGIFIPNSSKLWEENITTETQIMAVIFYFKQGIMITDKHIELSIIKIPQFSWSAFHKNLAKLEIMYKNMRKIRTEIILCFSEVDVTFIILVCKLQNE